MEVNFKYNPEKLVRTARGYVGRIKVVRGTSTESSTTYQYEVEFIKPGC